MREAASLAGCPCFLCRLRSSRPYDSQVALQARVQAWSCRSPVAQPIAMVYCRSPIRPATLALQAGRPRCRSFLVLSLACAFQTTSFGNSFHLSLEVGKRSAPDKLIVPVLVVVPDCQKQEFEERLSLEILWQHVKRDFGLVKVELALCHRELKGAPHVACVESVIQRPRRDLDRIILDGILNFVSAAHAFAGFCHAKVENV